MKPAISMLEGKWFPQKHVSIRELFSPLFNVWLENGDRSYHYEQFTNEAAFCSAIRYSFQKNRANTIYIGAHGDHNCIHGFHDEGISRTIIKNAIVAQDGVTKRGLYFAACSFGHLGNASLLLEASPRVEWVAGYQEDVDWIDSSALDLCFFRNFLFPTPGTGRKKPTTVLGHLDYATKKIMADMGPMATRLGFHVFVRGAKGRVIDLTTVQ